MKGYLTSYVDLFEGGNDAPTIDSIEIPLIQRDYAQGRKDVTASEIRANFLEALFDAISGGEPLGLDFVYGRVDAGTLYPLDGQQRLTTLFLLHWYLASAAGDLEPRPAWTRFSYATRPTARLFCQQLAAHALPTSAVNPSRWITDQEWYLHVWRNDPTIQAMLVMLDDIHSAVEQRGLDMGLAWEQLKRDSAPAVSFYLLPLDDLDSDEEIYIKMNSRGRLLTAFENFKARFEQDITHLPRADEFAKKIDGSWSDLMWSFRGDDNIIDDELIRYLDFVTELSELREGALGSGPLRDRAQAVFGPKNSRAAEHLDFLFKAFDCWKTDEHVSSVFDRLFSTAVPGDATYDVSRVTLFGPTNTNLFEACCRSFDGGARARRSFTLQESLLLYATLVHLIHNTDDVVRRMRFLRNLIAASEDEMRRDYMPGLLGDVETIIISGDLGAVTTFSSNQVHDEQLKEAFLQTSPELADVLFRLEDHPILRGTLSAFDFDSTTFRDRAEAFEAAFADTDSWLKLTGALLATGDYQRRRPNSSGWQFGTSSPRNEAVWRELLTDAPRGALGATRGVLGEFLDGVAASTEVIPEHFDTVMATWLLDREEAKSLDWRYYVVKYASMREGATGIYFGADGQLGYSMCMLRTKQRNGLYRDPILLQIWRTSGVGELVEDPWFTGYETEPRWLRLVRSRVGMRSVAAGIELARPRIETLNAVFETICESRDDIIEDGEGYLLLIPQADHVDLVNRVEAGAELLKTFVDAGL